MSIAHTVYWVIIKFIVGSCSLQLSHATFLSDLISVKCYEEGLNSE